MSKQRAKGTAAETAVVLYLRRMGLLYAERRALHGAADKGDITGIPEVMIEVKNHSSIKLAEWIGEVEAQKVNADADIGVVWHKRKGKGDPSEWYVTMTGAQFVTILTDYASPYYDKHISPNESA